MSEQIYSPVSGLDHKCKFQPRKARGVSISFQNVWSVEVRCISYRARGSVIENFVAGTWTAAEHACITE
jgi:hypothetical protein